jgi:uncharacterized protein (DUF779 family)
MTNLWRVSHSRDGSGEMTRVLFRIAEMTESTNTEARPAGASAMEPPAQVVCTAAATALMEKLAAKHGPLMFHQSGGCCDGSSPMCYPRGEFLVGDSDVLLETLGETPFYMSRSQFEYWKHTQIILDVVPGRGGMFSLEGPEGVRFLVRSRVFTDDEIGALRAAGRI